MGFMLVAIAGSLKKRHALYALSVFPKHAHRHVLASLTFRLGDEAYTSWAGPVSQVLRQIFENQFQCVKVKL